MSPTCIFLASKVEVMFLRLYYISKSYVLKCAKNCYVQMVVNRFFILQEFGVISNSRLIQTCQQVGQYYLCLRCSVIILSPTFSIEEHVCERLVFIKFVFLSVRKMGHAYNPPEFPYKIQNVLECEFYLLEALVSAYCCFVRHDFHVPFHPNLQEFLLVTCLLKGMLSHVCRIAV